MIKPPILPYKTFKFKADWSEKNGKWPRSFSGFFFQRRFLRFRPWLRGFSGNFFRNLSFQLKFEIQKFPEKPLSHGQSCPSPIRVQILSRVWISCPDFSLDRIMTRFWGKIFFPGNSFRKISCIITRNCEIWKKSTKSFRDIPCVNARFLEIVSESCLYGFRPPIFSKWPSGSILNRSHRLKLSHSIDRDLDRSILSTAVHLYRIQKYSKFFESQDSGRTNKKSSRNYIWVISTNNRI